MKKYNWQDCLACCLFGFILGAIFVIIFPQEETFYGGGNYIDSCYTITDT
ncbi:MAG: hypothetical protein PHS34_09030 [Candidatus Omnitrophica bacterium]|nr:hypothetical protein [Candidatus Omnitrophota bacterium]